MMAMMLMMLRNSHKVPFFIDRSPTLFPIILDYLRGGGGPLPIPTHDPPGCQRLRAEADFYLLPGLVALVDEAGTLVGSLSKLSKVCLRRGCRERSWITIEEKKLKS